MMRYRDGMDRPRRYRNGRSSDTGAGASREPVRQVVAHDTSDGSRPTVSNARCPTPPTVSRHGRVPKVTCSVRARRSISHCGLGPTLTPRTTTPMKRRTSEVSSTCTATVPASPLPLPATGAGIFESATSRIGKPSGRLVIAAISRARPRCESRSGRLAPTSMTSRESPIGIARRNGVPGATSTDNSITP